MSNFSNYVGIDVAKKDFYACFDERSESRKFNNTAVGISSLIHHLEKNNFHNQNTIIGLESTGSYHLRLCLQCAGLGFKVKIINPLIVKKQNQTNLRRVKNDKKDASLIRYCLIQGAGYTFAETPETLLLKSLVRQRNCLANSMLKNKRQIADVEYKEDCLKAKFNPVYRHPKQLTAYVGLDSRVHQSGTSVRGKGYISKRGNKILRTRLYNATHVAVLHPNLFQSFSSPP